MTDDLPNVEDGIEFNLETETYRAAFDRSKTRPSIAVVKVLSKVKEKEATELAPLYDTIDSEALDRFLTTTVTEHDSGDRQAEFEYGSYKVTVMSYGIVKVQPTESADSISEE